MLPHIRRREKLLFLSFFAGKTFRATTPQRASDTAAVTEMKVLRFQKRTAKLDSYLINLYGNVCQLEGMYRAGMYTH